MATIVVGGHSRKVGKTSVISALIREFAEYRWTAIKLSPHAHGSETGDAGAIDITEESGFLYRLARLLHCGWIAPKPKNDTSRFLAAGSSRAIFVSFFQGGLDSAMDRLSPVIQASPFTIVESNSITRMLQPDFCLVVLKTDVEEFKDSAREMLKKADAALIVDCGKSDPHWMDNLRLNVPGIALFSTPDPLIVPVGLLDMVRKAIRVSRSEIRG